MYYIMWTVVDGYVINGEISLCLAVFVLQKYSFRLFDSFGNHCASFNSKEESEI